MVDLTQASGWGSSYSHTDPFKLKTELAFTRTELSLLTRDLLSVGLIWDILLCMCHSYWLINKAAFTYGRAEYIQAGRDM